MEFVFGEAPPTSITGSSESQPVSQDSEFISTENIKNESKLTHVSVKGEAQMVDVSHKDISKRVAIASCKVILGKTVYDLVSANHIAKGDVLSVAKIAGITGAKQTSNLIPLCHNIDLTHVRVDLRLNHDKYCVEIEGEAASTGKTGVEMEAMTAVTLAGLTVYDMCKAASKDIQITDVRLEHKVGGKSGNWSREK
ncbi:putative lyase [Helianthus annuus]|nr:putative lyase [Helianthus annuus]